MPLPNSLHIEAMQIYRAFILYTLFPGVHTLILQHIQYLLPHRDFFITIDAAIHISVLGFNQYSGYSTIKVPGSIVQIIEVFDQVDDFFES